MTITPTGRFQRRFERGVPCAPEQPKLSAVACGVSKVRSSGMDIKIGGLKIGQISALV